MKHRERGAALIETALALPAILFALYGVSWGIRAGVASERAESAVRYAGVISAQQSPYFDYSLYTLYNNLGPISNVKTANCAKPTNLLVDGGTLPVVVPGTASTKKLTPAFWQPEIVQPSCATTPGRQLYTGPTRDYLLLQSVPTMVTNVSDGGYFGSAGPDSFLQSSLLVQDKFYRSPDLSTLMHCASSLSNAVSASLAPLKYASTITTIQQLQPGDFNSTPISVSPTCTTGVGTQPIPPTPVPTSLAPGTPAPTATPGPQKSPTPPPTPSPTATAATPKPSSTPTAPASVAPTSSPGGGGGGGGGGGNPTPTPTPGKGGSPAPGGSPSGAPSGTPSTTPVTPSPSVPPSSPKPSATPTAAPTHTPVPSPSPSQPPGSIS